MSAAKDDAKDAATGEQTEIVMLAPDPIETMKAQGKSPELAGLLAWLIPGAGHLYAGHRIKGALGLILILGLFASGVVYSRGECVSLRKDGGHNFAFLAQIGAGLPTFLALGYDGEKLPGLTPGYKRLIKSDHAAYSEQVPRSETGLLFTMIAGLLNMLLVWDALSGVPGGTQQKINEARQKRKLEALRAEIAAAEGSSASDEAEAKDGDAKDGDAKDEAKDGEAKDDAAKDDAAKEGDAKDEAKSDEAKDDAAKDGDDVKSDAKDGDDVKSEEATEEPAGA